MAKKVYRNIYLIGEMPKFTGDQIIYYSGRIIRNARNSGALKEYDRSQDYYFGCNCLANTIKAMIKVQK
jgi:hypothetical protein